MQYLNLKCVLLFQVFIYFYGLFTITDKNKPSIDPVKSPNIKQVDINWPESTRSCSGTQEGPNYNKAYT